VDLQLKGKIVVITGGSRGIGKACAWEFAREGADVALVARDWAALEAAVAEITGATGRKVKGFVADTGDDAAVKKAVAGIVAAFGRIDILVNAAAQPGGQLPPPKLAEITNDHFWSDVNVKVMGYLRMAREIAPVMARNSGGRIVNISGLAARQTGTIIGSMRNVSVASLTKTMAEELSPQNIAVVCVHPGVTRTEKTPAVVERQAKAKNVPKEQIEKEMASRNLARKLITSEEIAALVTFLASPRAVSVNGDSIAAGGGVPGSIHY
jgi:NAD(P)-dependent dehydrogenase (short-subunit alcohol dehydrogenase family)